MKVLSSHLDTIGMNEAQYLFLEMTGFGISKTLGAKSQEQLANVPWSKYHGQTSNEAWLTQISFQIFTYLATENLGLG